jgi:hypothetical protein
MQDDEIIDRRVEEAALAAYKVLGEMLATEWIPAALVRLEALVDAELVALTETLRTGTQ